MRFSIVIPTWCRTDILIKTLHKLETLNPSADEIIIHVDAGDTKTADALKKEFPKAGVICARQPLGPGGGRNILVEAAANDWVLSLDDDSWPIEQDFLEQLERVIRSNTAKLIACKVIEKEAAGKYAPGDVTLVGCGCVVNKHAFKKAGGFIPMRYAYGMEENDLLIKLLNFGMEIHYASNLIVFHDRDRNGHAAPCINAAHITNTALFAYLRYPLRYWPFGILQVINRVLFSLRMGRFKGIFKGLAQIPFACWSNRLQRKTVSVDTFHRFRQLVR